MAAESLIRRNSRTQCPECSSNRFYVIETRVNHDRKRRRRWACSDCGYRETTIEITKHEHERLLVADQAIKDVVRAIAGQSRSSKPSASRSCQCCLFLTDGKCEFGFPEAGDDFAEDCSLYKRS